MGRGRGLPITSDDPNVPDEYGDMALVGAARSGQVGVIRVGPRPLLGVDRRPPHYRHETHRGLGEDLSQRRSSSSVEVLRVPCRELTDSAGSHLQSSSGTQQTGLTASSQAPSSWHSRPSD